ncbi:hypothetical protein ACS0TY_015662 [Phlomoides rotata]
MGKGKSQVTRSRQEFRNNDDDDSNQAKRKKTATKAEADGDVVEQRRWPLSEVISDCTERWFQDTLKEANAGDVNMQVLLGQMYYSGYGAPKDADKGKHWMTRASRMRSSVWKVVNKRPGYNVSDSDSDDTNGDS